MTRVVHLTSVHPYNDPRILLRECRSLAAAGYDTHLVAPGAPLATVEGVRVHPVRARKTRLGRVFLTVLDVLRKGWALGGQVYHVHDPELLGIALILRFVGKVVVYDMHEDYATLILEKSYLPSLVRWPLSRIVRRLENIAIMCLSAIILAERYYLRFSTGYVVMNYPDLEPDSFPDPEERQGPWTLLFTGSVGEYRGALVHSQIPLWVDNVNVDIVGKCPPELADSMRSAAGDGVDRLRLEGVGEYLCFDRILEHYRRTDILCGLALFPEGSDVQEKELTKFFEYMAAGLPIVCSNFPRWKELVEDEGVGIAVDPSEPEAVAATVRWLMQHVAERNAMGERGKLLVRKRYNWRTQEDVLLKAYSNIAQF